MSPLLLLLLTVVAANADLPDNTVTLALSDYQDLYAAARLSELEAEFAARRRKLEEDATALATERERKHATRLADAERIATERAAAAGREIFPRNFHVVSHDVQGAAALDGDDGAVFNVSLTLRVHDEQARDGLQPQTCWPLTMSLAMSLTMSLERVKRTPQYLRRRRRVCESECIIASADPLPLVRPSAHPRAPVRPSTCASSCAPAMYRNRIRR